MKRKAFICILLMSLGLMFSIIFTSCNSLSDITEIHMKDENTLEIQAGDFSYDDKKIVLVYKNGDTEEIDLKEEMIPEVERLKFYKIGEQEVKIVYSNRLSTTMKINVTRHNFDDIYELEGYTCKYDGKPHRVDLNYELPEGAKIGYNSKTLRTKLVIEKDNYDTSSIEFNDLVTVYDGSPKRIEATNLPAGVTCTYSIYKIDGSVRVNNAVNAGEYKVVASFKDNDKNYNKIDNMEAKLTIKKAKYDMSLVKLDDVTKTYDGLEYTPILKQGSILPDGVSVQFKCYDSDGNLVNSNANAGEYKIVASFSGNADNYEEIEDIEAKLVVEPKVVSINNVSFESKTVNFDRQVHSLEFVGTLPTGVSYSYRNNDKTYAGEYRVVLQFTTSNPNEKLDVTEMVAYLIINKIEENPKIYDDSLSIDRDILTSDLYFTLEDNKRVLKINGLDLETYKISKYSFTDIETDELIGIDDLEASKSYRYSVTLSYVDSNVNKSVILSPLSGTIDFNLV